MSLLLSPEGLSALDAVVKLRPLLAFDFDGTLAPIVPHPDSAAVPPLLAEQLRALATHLPVAIVTGRAVADVLPRLGFEPHYVVGNHGSEEPGVPLAPDAAAALDSLRQQIAGQAQALDDAGVLIEDKHHSFTLHHRLATDQVRAVTSIEQVLVGLDPALRRFGGKFVVNVVAAQARDKGDAVVSLVERSKAGAALFIGDDVNDESVFECAAPHWVTVRIGRDDPSSKARFFLDEHAEVTQVLARLLSALEAGTPSAGQADEPPEKL